ncbi:unnamed protein product, partial [Amoebophrya sp. A120]
RQWVDPFVVADFLLSNSPEEADRNVLDGASAPYALLLATRHHVRTIDPED